jgi:hypothetical protein
MKLKNIGYAAIMAFAAAAFVIGSAGPSEAKHKKKMAETPAPTPLICMPGSDKPVCGTRGGMKFTYASACYAAKDGAKVTSSKACPAKAANMAKPAKKKAMKKT